MTYSMWHMFIFFPRYERVRSVRAESRICYDSVRNQWDYKILIGMNFVVHRKTIETMKRARESEVNEKSRHFSFYFLFILR